MSHPIVAPLAVHSARFIIAICASLLALGSATPDLCWGKEKRATDRGRMTDTLVKIALGEGRQALALSITFPCRVKWALYDSVGHCLIAHWDPAAEKKDKKEGDRCPGAETEVMAFDPESRKPLWSLAGPHSVERSIPGRLVLSPGYDQNSRLIDLANGRQIKELPHELGYLEPDGMPVLFNKQECSRYDLQTGLSVWIRKGSTCVGKRRDVRLGDSLFVVADGLHAIDLRTGEGWDYPLPTSHKGTGEFLAKEAGKAVALGILGALTGRIPAAGVGSVKVTHDLYALPLVEQDRVFFAATSKAVCLDRATGKPLWQTDLGPEPGTMMLASNDARIAVVGLGYRYIDYVKTPVAAPTIALLSRDSGTVVARAKLDRPAEVKGFALTTSGAFVLTRDRLYHFDDSLTLLGALDLPEGHRTFEALKAGGDSLHVITDAGRLAVSPTTLEVLAAGREPVGEEAAEPSAESRKSSRVSKQERWIQNLSEYFTPSGDEMSLILQGVQSRLEADKKQLAQSGWLSASDLELLIEHGFKPSQGALVKKEGRTVVLLRAPVPQGENDRGGVGP